jgi:N-acetyltransferase 10
LKAGCPHPN